MNSENRQGRKGATGDTGLTGKTGAPGKTGESGERGAPGFGGQENDVEERRITNLRLGKSERHAATVFLITMFAVLVIGWGLDYNSCRRQTIPQQVLRDFLVTAGTTRANSAAHETGLQHNLDLWAANRWINYDAARLHIHSADSCLAILPPVH